MRGFKPALHGGDDCLGDTVEIELCNSQPCPGILLVIRELHRRNQWREAGGEGGRETGREARREAGREKEKKKQ